jgi:hypothetical protein
VKEAASLYFCWGEARAWAYQTSWGTANYIYDKREFRIVLLRFWILGGGGGHWKFKKLGGGYRKFTNNLNRGPVKIWAFFKTSSSPSLGVINVLSLILKYFHMSIVEQIRHSYCNKLWLLTS